MQISYIRIIFKAKNILFYLQTFISLQQLTIHQLVAHYDYEVQDFNEH